MLKFIFGKLNGKEISDKQEKVLMKIFEIFYSFPDPLVPPSSFNVYSGAACGVDYFKAISAGLLMMGDKHACFSDIYDFLKHGIKNGANTPGLGNPVYQYKEDPRVTELIEYFNEIDYQNFWLEELALASSNEKVPMNIAGVVVAVLIDCGCNRQTVNYFPVMARLLGMTMVYDGAIKEKVDFTDICVKLEAK